MTSHEPATAPHRDLLTLGKLTLALAVMLGIQQGLIYGALALPWRWAALTVLGVDLLWSALMLTVCIYLVWSTWHSWRAAPVAASQETTDMRSAG